MSQTWTDDIYDPDHEADDDLQNMENNFAALKSTFSGTAAPSNAVAGMQWFDTDNKVLKVRDAANSTWYGVMHGDTSQKVWIYRNSAIDGWVVDSSVSDRVLALKGGDTYTTGAAVAGTWSHSHTMDHTHTIPGHQHDLEHDVQTPVTKLTESKFVFSDTTSGDQLYTWISGELGSNPDIWKIHNRTESIGDSTSGGSSSSSTGTASTWRPAAAVGTLQRLNL